MASVCRFVSASLATLHWQCPWVFWVWGVPVVICAGANRERCGTGLIAARRRGLCSILEHSGTCGVTLCKNGAWPGDAGH